MSAARALTSSAKWFARDARYAVRAPANATTRKCQADGGVGFWNLETGVGCASAGPFAAIELLLHVELASDYSAAARLEIDRPRGPGISAVVLHCARGGVRTAVRLRQRFA